MNATSITYKPLKPEFSHKGFVHTQLCREGDFAIYHKYAEKSLTHHKEFDCGFEVVVIKRHNGYKLGDVYLEPSEVYPGDSQWGTFGWTYSDLLSARNKFEKLVSGKFEVVDGEVIEIPDEPSVPQPQSEQSQNEQKKRGRKAKPMPNLQFPDGEFDMQTLADLNGMPKANIYQIVMKFNLVRESRRESRGSRGRQTVIYVKNEKVTA